MRPETDWNGGIRELTEQLDYLDESVYCTVCGMIYVPSTYTQRQCPACLNAARIEAIEERLDALEDGEDA